MEEYTYQPRTERGEAYAKGVGDFINAFGIPTMGHISAYPHGPKRIKGAPEPTAWLDLMDSIIISSGK
jgi:hypothetical protein